MNAKPRPLLTTPQAGALLGVTDETVRRYCVKGVLPFKTSGNRILVARADVERLAEGHGRTLTLTKEQILAALATGSVTVEVSQ